MNKMKILFISDIHGIYDNLEYIKSLDENNNFDKIVILGDIYNNNSKYKCSVLKVKEFINNYYNKIIVIRGNCDNDIDISTRDLLLINVDGIDVYLTHGDKYNDIKNKIFKDKTGVLLFGHKHVPYIKKINNMIYVCVGSISLPRFNSKPSYVIYENKTFIIYDIYGNILDKVCFIDC